MKKTAVKILSALLMLSMVFSTNVFAANEETSAWDSFLGLFSTASATDVGVEYRGHIQNKGDFPLDGSWIQGPNELGTRGQFLRMEGFWIKLTNIPADLNIKYNVHVQNEGWLFDEFDSTLWPENGEFCGTKAKMQRIEAVKIVLVDDDGNISVDYDVMYQGHVQDVGDLPKDGSWFENGEQLGTTGSSLRLEALKVKIVQKEANLDAYEEALAAATQADYTAASWPAYKAIVDANVVDEDNLQSEVNAATAAITAAQADLVKIPKVTAVTATNPKVLTITGTDLAGLTADQIAVESNDVVSYVANAAGTSATATLDANLAPGVDTDVNITIEGTTTKYVVNFVMDVQTATVVEKTYDDDRTGQVVSFKVDGQLADVDYLALAGYNVNFVATDLDGVAANIFVTGNTSADGKLVAPGVIGDYNVEVQLTKSGTAMVSDTGIIKIANLDAEVASIDSVVFGLGTTTDYNDDFVGVEFALNSTKLVAGETAEVHKILATVGGESVTVADGGFTVESSNSAVISVAPSTSLTPYALTANAKGTATITIKVGDKSKTYTFTVVNDTRELTKVSALPTTSKGVVGIATDVKFTTLDQYGDPFAVVTADVGDNAITEVIPNNADGDALVADFEVVTDVANSIGVATIPLTPAAVGTGTVYFKDVDAHVVGTLGLNISENNAVASKKLELVTVDNQSTSSTLELSDPTKDMVTYQLGLYNASGVSVGLGDFTALTGVYTVTSADPTIATVAVDPGNDSFTVSAVKAGSVDMVVTDRATDVYVTKVRITVTNNPYKITAVAFKTVGTIDFTGKEIFAKDVLTLTASDSDDVVSGITLSKSTASKVRIAEAAGVGTTIAVDDLYLDLDNDGLATVGDVDLGTLSAVAASDAVGFTVSPYTTGYVANSIISATASGDKGTVIIKVMTDPTDVTTAIASTSFAINVK